MPIRMDRGDLEFLQRVRELGQQGRTQQEIASDLAVSLNALRYRLSDLGFKMVSTIDLKTTLTDQWLGELLDAGSISVRDAAEAGVA